MRKSGTLAHFGSPEWIDPPPGSLPHCLCVGRLSLDGGRRFGGCLRIHERWILTAHHVVDIPDLARRFTVTFNDVRNAPAGPFHHRLDPDRGFYPSADGIRGPSGEAWELDYVLIALKVDPAVDPSSVTVGRISRQVPATGEPAQIAQYLAASALMTVPLEELDVHPDAGQVRHVDADYLYYKTSTQRGASGSPVFDRQWNVVGLHTLGYRYSADDPWQRQFNSGTLIGRILEDVRTRYPALRVDDLVTFAQPSPGAEPA